MVHEPCQRNLLVSRRSLPASVTKRSPGRRLMRFYLTVSYISVRFETVDETWTIGELVEEVARRIAALPRPQNGQVRAVPDDRTIRYYATIGLLDRPSAMRGRTALYAKKHVAQVVAIKRLQAMGRSLAEIQALWPTLDDATLSRMSGVELPIAPGAARATTPAPEGATPGRAARKDFWRTAPARLAGDVGAKRDAVPTGADAGAASADLLDAGAKSASLARHAAASPVAAARGADTLDAGAGAVPADAERAARHDAAPVAAAPDAATHADAAGPAVHAMPAAAPTLGAELRVELAPRLSLSIAVSGDIAISLADVAAIRAAAAPLIAELARRRLAVHAGEGDDV